MSFGFRFWLVSLICCCLATALIYLQLTIPEYLEGYDPTLITFSSQLAFHLILLGYYFLLRTPLKTRLSVVSYLIYLFGGFLIVSATILQVLGLLFDASYLDTTALALTLALPLGVAFLPPFFVYQWQKLQEQPWFRQMFLEGKGGSARWASVGTFDGIKGKLIQHVFSHWFSKKGVTAHGIYLGRSLFSDDPFRRHIVLQEDCHNITMGLTGAGKTTTVQNMTYSLYEGSIIGFDPKGELSRATANRRHFENITIHGKTKKHFANGQVYVADPFGLNAKYGIKDFGYNPLAEVKSDLSNANFIASDISDASFTPEDFSNVHFEENPRNIFEGYIIHVLSAFPKECHNLPFVYDLLRGVNPTTGKLDFEMQKKVMLDMSNNPACGGLAVEAVRLLTDLGPNERGSMISTMSRHLKWIGNEQMRTHLKRSDFRFSDFGIKKIKINDKEQDLIETLYIVLPDPRIKEFMRYVRLMMIMSVRMMQMRNEQQKPKIPTLLIIDEMPRLGGKIEVIAEGFGILRSYGIKLWCFIQTLGQLKEDYPKRWSSMIGNSTLQAFGAGMGDNETAEYISKTLGSRIVRRYDKRQNSLGLPQRVVADEIARELLTPAEVTTKLGKSSNMQIIFPNDGLPMRLERLAFKKLKFKKRKFRALGLGGLKKQIED